MPSWLLLTYKLPSEPSARRVYIWRKLKRLGAILLHDSVWILPSNERTRENYQWLAAEIVELEGEAFVWETKLMLMGQEQELIRTFLAQVEDTYRELLADLEQHGADLATISRRYQQAQSQDYFQSTLGQKVRQALLEARGGPDE